MGMKTYEELKEMLCKELDEYADKGELSAGSLDVIHKLTDTIKNIDKIEMLIEMLSDDGYSGNYSRDGDWEARGSYRGGNSYRDGRSYAGRRRDNRGRYSREGAKDEMIDRLRDMMDMTTSDTEKTAIRRCISSLENA